MPTYVEIICPDCQNGLCRLSRWRSHQERVAHPGQQAYRCCACSHRFIAAAADPGGKRHRRSLPALLIALPLAAGLAVGLWKLWPSVAESVQGLTRTAPDHASAPHVRIDKAAQEGDPEAQYRLARRLLHDRTRGQEGIREAVLWLRKAAEGGHSGAMLQLGKLHRTGVGVLQNFEQALQWLHRAASVGNADAMMELGRLYRSGTGVRQDLKLAYVWFNRAAAALHPEAQSERESLALRLSATELKEAQERSAMQAATSSPAAAAATAGSTGIPR